jgi:hypothetical protein
VFTLMLFYCIEILWNYYMPNKVFIQKYLIIGKVRVFMTTKKKVFWIVTLIILAAVLIVICISFVTGGHPSEYDGTLVKIDCSIPRFM